MEENNYYEDKKNRQFLDNASEKNKATGKTQSEKREKEESQNEKLTRTAKEVGTDVAVGLLGGGLGAAILGRYSFFAGLLVSGFGHYTKNKYIARLGLGIMASSSMTAAQNVKQDPKASMIENIHERVKAFGNELQRKLLIDKLLPGKKQGEIKSQDHFTGVTLKNEVVNIPPAQDFELKNKLEQNKFVQNKNIPSDSAFQENKVVELYNNKTLYGDNKEDLDDITDRLY